MSAAEKVFFQMQTGARSNNRKEWLGIKTNAQKKVDRVLPCEIIILTSFSVMVFSQVN